MVVEHLEAAHRAHVIGGEPVLDTFLVKEVLEVAREEYNVIFHAGDLGAYLADRFPMVLLVEFVQC